MTQTPDFQRRRTLGVAAGVSSLILMRAAAALARSEKRLNKQIPSTGEAIAPIGMGTWITFNVGRDPAIRAQRGDVLRTFFEAGGGMIDSSPMYGSAQEVLGDLLTGLNPDNLFAATKVWTGGDGTEQIRQAHQLWRLDRFDLLQVHNLLNWRAHLPLLRQMKAAGKLRYLGITTSHGRRHSDLEQIMKSQPLDFVQLTYNALDRDVEQRLLPLARDKGIAVIANRPFRRGALPRSLQGRQLPAIAGDLGCNTWAELLLKFVISHPAITCVIPATSRVDHMQENMSAGTGAMPSARERERIARAVANG